MGVDRSFPKQKMSFKAKGKKWRKSHLDWADHNSYLNNNVIRKKLKGKKINLNLFNGKVDLRDMKLVLNPGGLEQYYIPDAIQHYPIIAPRVNVLVGEEKRRKFDWSVHIVNPDTISKIKEEKMQMISQKMSEFFGADISEEDLAKEMERYSDYINFDYQDLREKRANLLMRWYIESLDMKIKFQQGFKDALIMGEEIYMFDIVNGEVTFEKLNPLKVHTLRGGYGNKIEDADVIVIDDFWSPGRIQDTYYSDLTEKDQTKLDNGDFRGDGTDLDGENLAIDDKEGWEIYERETINTFIESSGIFSGSGGQGRNTYTDGAGNIRVIRMMWRSMKQIYKVSYFDELGRAQVKFRSENYVVDAKMGETAEKLWVTQWWKGAKIGKDTYVQIKPKEIQYNKINQPSFNSSGIVGQIYNTNEQESVSMVDRSKPFQYMFDISFYRMNEAMAKYLGSIVELDLAKIPTGWSVTKWLYFARKSGISVVDSFKEGQRGMAKGKLAGSVGNTTGKILDQKVGDFIQTHMDMMEFATAKMDEITGVSRQRLGQVENRETVGGIERAVSQSNHITEELFTMHDYCKKRCFQILLETAKIALKGNSKKFSYIADDMSRQIMEIDGDEFAEEEYGLQVSNEDNINQMEQKLDGMVQLGLQNQMISFSTAMKIYNSPSIREVQRLIEKDETKMHERNAASAENEQKQIQVQAAALKAKEDLEAQREDSKFMIEDKTKRYIAELKATTDRINKEFADSDKDIEKDDDTLEYEKFAKDYELKNKALHNDMKKHGDNLKHKEKELAVKKIAANKKSTTSK